MVCCANQLTGLYMRATLALNGLNELNDRKYYKYLEKSSKLISKIVITKSRKFLVQILTLNANFLKLFENAISQPRA